MEDRTKKLIAVGASVGANCHPCLEYHVGRALASGLSRDEIMEAVETAKAVRAGAASSMDKLAVKLLNREPGAMSDGADSRSCCCA